MIPDSRPETGCCSPLAALLTPRFFKALGDPNRLALLLRLATCREPQTVTELTRCCPATVSVVSRHLATLREAGIVEAIKRGKEVHYRLPVASLARTLRAMADALEACCTPEAGTEVPGETGTA